MSLDELVIAEELFRVNVQVYMLLPAEDSEDEELNDTEQEEEEVHTRDKKIQAELIRRSHRRYDETMYLNLFGRHFSFISDLDKYSRSYACAKCCTVFKRSSDLQRHEPTCDVNVKHRFSGGSYQLPLTVFDKLSELGVEMEDDMKYYPYRATYDYTSNNSHRPVTNENMN